MSGFCDFCRVWHSGSCCHPGRPVDAKPFDAPMTNESNATPQLDWSIARDQHVRNEMKAIERAFGIDARQLQAAGGEGDGWALMTKAVMDLKMRHVDKHEGDIYHALQSLLVKFGKPWDGKLTEPVPPPAGGFVVVPDDIEVAEAALERALTKFTERQSVDPPTGYGEYNARDEEYHADLVSALDAVKDLHDVPPDRRNEDFDHE